VSAPPDARAECATAQAKEVTQMSKIKKLLAATLAVLALAAVPSTSIALIGPAQALAGQCNGSGGC
jgi:hypothetical protein